MSEFALLFPTPREYFGKDLPAVLESRKIFRKMLDQAFSKAIDMPREEIEESLERNSGKLVLDIDYVTPEEQSKLPLLKRVFLLDLPKNLQFEGLTFNLVENNAAFKEFQNEMRDIYNYNVSVHSFSEPSQNHINWVKLTRMATAAGTIATAAIVPFVPLSAAVVPAFATAAWGVMALKAGNHHIKPQIELSFKPLTNDL